MDLPLGFVTVSLIEITSHDGQYLDADNHSACRTNASAVQVFLDQVIELAGQVFLAVVHHVWKHFEALATEEVRRGRG